MDAFVLATVVVFGQCTGPQCAPSHALSRAMPAQPVIEWRRFEGDPDRWYLFRDGLTVGAWCNRERYWRDYNVVAEAWSAATSTAPYVLPESIISVEVLPQPREDLPHSGDDAIPNFGLDLNKLAANNGRDKYSYCGTSVTREQAMAILEHPLPDDRDMLRVTLIGSDDACDEVQKELNRTYPAAVLIQSYSSSNHPMLRGTGFDELGTGNPLIVVQAPSGKVLHLQRDGVDIARAINIAEGLRRRDPNFDPTKIPDLRVRTINPKSIPTWLWVVVGGGLFVWILRRNS